MKKTILLILLLSMIMLRSVVSEELVLGVIPFENLSGRDHQDHVGFQISEFLVSAYSAFEGITVLERGKLQTIIEEQKFQLSGMTDETGAVEIGELLNARQIVQGSYHYPGQDIEISGQIVDVESGEVIAAATVDGPSDDIRPVLKALLYKMVEQQSGASVKMGADLAFTIPVEARLVNLENQSIESIETYAKALEAAFNKNDEEALSYLQKSISGTELNYMSYAGAAEAYLETYKRVQSLQGDNIYTRMLKKQIDMNEILLQQAEDISLYRNTVKLLFEKIQNSLGSEMFTLETGRDYTIEEGTVSIGVTPPSEISIGTNEDTRELIMALFDQQKVMAVSQSRNSTKITPASLPDTGELLPRTGLATLFKFDISADISYAIQFVSPSGDVVYQLDALEAANVFTIKDGVINWSTTADNQYNEHKARPGWRYENGKVEIQARELMNLGDVRVVLQPESFRKNTYFPVYQDRIWQSVIMHAYRQKYIKISPSEGDSCPQVKDIELANYFMTFPDFPMTRIPLISEKKEYPSFADMTAVVYWADESNTLVEGLWSGSVSGESPTVTGELTPRSILYFPVNNTAGSWEDFSQGRGSFTVRNQGQEKSISFNLTKGMVYTDEQRIVSFTSDGSTLFTSGSKTMAFNVSDRVRRLWTAENSGGFLRVHNSVLYVWDNNKLYGLNAANGLEKLSYILRGNQRHHIAPAGELLYLSGNSVSACIDANSGSELWRTNNYGPLSIAGEWLLIGDDYYNRITGEKTGRLENRGISVSDSIAIGDRFFATGQYDTRSYPVGGSSNEAIWKSDKEGSSISYDSGRLFIIDNGDGVSCIEMDSGRLIWNKADYDGWDLMVFDNRVYVIGNKTYCLDAVTGELLWSGNYKSKALELVNGYVVSGDNNGFFIFDPDVFFD